MRTTATTGLIRALVDGEAGAGADAARRLGAVALVAARLCRRLSARIGLEGFSAILGRSLWLAKRDFPNLDTVSVAADGSLAGLTDGADDSGIQSTDAFSIETAVESAVAVLAELVQLLIALIGEDLAMRLVRTEWPQAAPSASRAREDVNK